MLCAQLALRAKLVEQLRHVVAVGREDGGAQGAHDGNRAEKG